MIKVKCGAIVKEISDGALKWYLMSGWKIIKQKKEEKNDSTNTEKNIKP